MRPYSLDLRERVIGAYERGEGTEEELAETFHVNINTIGNWLKLRKATGSLVPRPHGGGVDPLISASELGQIRALVYLDPTATSAEYAAEYERTRHVHVSRQTMDRALARAHETRKKITPHAAERDSPEVQLERAKFWQRAMRWDAERLVFVDEFGLNQAMSRRYARAPVGNRACVAIPFNWGGNQTLTLGLRSMGIVAPWLHEGAANKESFEVYVETQLVPTLQEGDIVLLDHLKAHKSKRISRMIEAKGAKLELLPRYSPELNPTELAGGVVKQAVRSQAPRKARSFLRAVRDGIGKITLGMALAFFTYAGYQVPQTVAPTQTSAIRHDGQVIPKRG